MGSCPGRPTPPRRSHVCQKASRQPCRDLHGEEKMKQRSSDCYMPCKLPCCALNTEPKTQQRNLNISYSLIGRPRELSILQRTWMQFATDIPGNGIAVMLLLLERYPEVRKLFSFGNLRRYSYYRENTVFRKHSFVFLQSVNAVMENLNSLDQTIGPVLVEIGHKHASIANFKPEFFSYLPDVMAFVWEEQLRDRFTPFTELAWRNVFNYIVSRLTEGCNLAVVESI